MGTLPPTALRRTPRRHQRNSASEEHSYHHGDLANALIDAGLRLLADGGADALTLRAAARLAGVSHAAPYRHFEDKMALLAAIAEQGFRLLAETMQAAVNAHPGDPLRQYRLCATAYVRFATEHPHHFRVMFEGKTGSRQKYPALLSAAEGTLAVLISAIRIAQNAQLLRNDIVAEEIALTSWSLVHGVALLTAGEQFPASVRERYVPREITEEYIGLLLEGIAATRSL
jgi:AcrR family transcriptional regulator